MGGALADSVCVTKPAQEYFLLLSSVGLCARPTPSEDSAPAWGPLLACVVARVPRLLRSTLEPSSPRPSVGGEAASSVARLQSFGERFLTVCPGYPLPSFRELRIPFAQLTAWVWLLDHVAPRSCSRVAKREARGHCGESGRDRGQPHGTQRPHRDSLWAGRDENSTRHRPSIPEKQRLAGPTGAGDQPVAVAQEVTRPAEGGRQRGPEGIEIPLDL